MSEFIQSPVLRSCFVQPAAVQTCLALRTIIRKLLWITVLKTAIWHWIWDRALPQCPFHSLKYTFTN